MKKLLLLWTVLFALCGCNQNDMDSMDDSPVETDFVPHFYGWMTLDDLTPETRGVADASKVWSRVSVQKRLTVKFLNGSDLYRELVKETAKEWEKNAAVKFRFVPDDRDALIRISFGPNVNAEGMMSSWALTGRDHLQVYANQDEPTVHFARWSRIADAAKRSDVLRAFGQVLGLELEFRHPDFKPEWILDEEGNIDEKTIRAYWENELKEFISWEELRKVVLTPLANRECVVKTESYDPNSVMTWPLFEMIAYNIPVVEWDMDYKSELSTQDKELVSRLYGNSGSNEVVEDWVDPFAEAE